MSRIYEVMFDSCRGQFYLTHIEKVPESLHMARYSNIPNGLIAQCNLLNGVFAHGAGEQQYVQSVDQCYALPEYKEWKNPPAPPQTEAEVDATIELPLEDLGVHDDMP